MVLLFRVLRSAHCRAQRKVLFGLPTYFHRFQYQITVTFACPWRSLSFCRSLSALVSADIRRLLTPFISLLVTVDLFFNNDIRNTNWIVARPRSIDRKHDSYSSQPASCVFNKCRLSNVQPNAYGFDFSRKFICHYLFLQWAE